MTRTRNHDRCPRGHCYCKRWRFKREEKRRSYDKKRLHFEGGNKE